MRTALWLAGCAVVLAVSSVAADDKDTIDPAKMVGTWKYVSGEKNGEKVDADRLKDQTVIITKDKITLKGEQTFVMKYTIDAKKKPAAIKMEMTESPFGAGATAEGIVEVDGDNLKMCYAQQGGAAPTKFATKEGSNQHLFVLKRSK
jgi:uncharacterized protein (TIGR03067 family)